VVKEECEVRQRNRGSPLGLSSELGRHYELGCNGCSNLEKESQATAAIGRVAEHKVMSIDKYFFKRLMLLCASVLLLQFYSAQGAAQVPSPSPSPTVSASPSPSPEEETITVANEEDPPTDVRAPRLPQYFIPVAPDVTTLDTKRFKVHMGFAMLGDYTFISQDVKSESQVGRQGGLGELRAGRVYFAGAIKFEKPWIFFIAYDINEHPSPGHNHAFDVLDYSLGIPLWKKARIMIGKEKEPFIYEVSGDAVSLPQQERILNAFFVTRNRGIKYIDNFKNDRIFLSVGIFNDYKTQGVKFSDGSLSVSGRLTGLPIFKKDGREYLHLGVGGRYFANDNQGNVRFDARPESNVIDKYVDTGDIPARHATELSFESLYTNGPYNVTSEYVHAWVNSPVMQNPGFDGFYVTGSYVITGESRIYDPKVGYARFMIPKSRWGAVEVVGRYSHVDLDDKLVKGGTLNKLYFGMNWWASIQWKLGVGYGFSDLNRFNTTGHTKALQLRMQWVY